MAVFRVTKAIDANTIEVNPNWSWQGSIGSLVKITGFRFANPVTTPFIINKLNTLLLNQEVELKNPVNNITPVGSNFEITASVYLSGVDISVYFPELKTPA